MTSPINSTPFLRTIRRFPIDSETLSREMDKAYLDTASAINERIIGIFPVLKPAVTGESWFIANNQRQQTLRQVYTFTSTASITHNVSVQDINQFTTCWGSYTDGTNAYGLFWATSVAIPGQITFYITSTQIVFVVGAGAPALTKGKIVLQWLSQP